MRSMLRLLAFAAGWIMAATFAAAAATPCPTLRGYVQSPAYSYRPAAEFGSCASPLGLGSSIGQPTSPECAGCGYAPSAFMAGIPLQTSFGCEPQGGAYPVSEYELIALPQDRGPHGRCEPIVPLSERAPAAALPALRAEDDTAASPRVAVAIPLKAAPAVPAGHDVAPLSARFGVSAAPPRFGAPEPRFGSATQASPGNGPHGHR